MRNAGDIHMSEQQRDDEVEAAVGLQRAHTDRDHALEVLELPSPPRHRLRAMLAHRRSRALAWEVLRNARHDIRMHTGALEHAGAGAIAGEWGVLSVARDVSLEETLDRAIARHGDEEQFTRAAAAIRSRLAAVRAAAVLQDTSATPTLERAVLSLAVLSPLETKRQLIDHLPARARPLPRSVDELDHHGSYTRSVTENASRIRLHDMVVGPAWGQGAGFGTSLLSELCRYADHRGLPIVCEMVTNYPRIDPGASRAEFDAQRRTDERRLAGWYHRHGFRASKDVDEWRSFTELRRDPDAAAVAHVNRG